MSRKEVEDSQHRFTQAKAPQPKKAKPTFLDNVKITEENSKPIEFHFKDRGELTEDTNTSYAKRVEYPRGKVEYFVKFATAGPAVGRILNPWGFNYTEGDDNRYEKTMGRKRYEFRKVTDNIFNSYIQFLKTRNERYILTAEREVNNNHG